MFRCAFGTDSFYHKINLFDYKGFRSYYIGNCVTVETKGFVANLAIEMSMNFFFLATTVIMAQAVFHETTTVIDAMYQMMFMKQSQCSENA